MNQYRLSVVVPAYNEEAVLDVFHERLLAVLDQLACSWELIYINDGSTDQTRARIQAFCADNPQVKSIHFSRNFGHQAAITAGMDHAGGDAVVIIDADLQDPPEVIPQLVSQWQAGYDVVYARRASRQGETAAKKGSARLYYRLLNRLTDVDIPLDVGDFRLIDARVNRALSALPEHNRYIRGLISWLGFKQTAVTYDRAARQAGQTKYSLGKMLRLATDGLTAFSLKPLQLGLLLGAILLPASVLLVLFVALAPLFGLVLAQTPLLLILGLFLFLFGLLFALIGLTGLYLGRIFEEVKNRPLYVVDQKDASLKTNARYRHL